MTNTHKILVVEDNEVNLQNAKKAFEEFIKEGLIKVNYAKNYEEAVPFKDTIDCALLDLYFPRKDAKEGINAFLNKYDLGARLGVDSELLKIGNGLYPVGLNVIDELNDIKKPSVLVSTVASGHGSFSGNNPFYRLRSIAENVPSLAMSWTPSESDAHIYSYVSENIEKMGSYGVVVDRLIKTENTWKAALKGIAKYLDYKKLDKNIKVNEKTEKKINDWVKKYKK
jgi:CheY-like chemotaxis protein